MAYRKKLIEVSLPLEVINEESAREKSIRHGHPSTLHLWWARRPLAACRAVLWSSLVDDPSEYMTDEKSANQERDRLFAILEKLVKWENINNEEVLDAAKIEIARSVARDLGCDVPVGKKAIREFLATKAPPVLDPFAGGGSIPLEAQRLGLRAYASDLNPVAVLINKALIEIPARFAGMLPIHPTEPGQRQDSLLKIEWKGAEGLAEDVRYYGKWMRDEAEKRVGHLYPKVKITEKLLLERPDLKKMGLRIGDELMVLAWLWARTVTCPNPACGCQMPLISSFWLSQKEQKRAWIEPIIDRDATPPKINYKIVQGSGIPFESPKIGRGAQFRCLVCGQIASEVSVRTEFKSKRDREQLIAIVTECPGGRTYFSPNEFDSSIATNLEPDWKPDSSMSQDSPNLVSGRGYGIQEWWEIFTKRQLVTITTLIGLIDEIKKVVESAALNHNYEDRSFSNDLDGAAAYANAVATYLAFAIDKVAEGSTKFCTWSPLPSKLHVVSTFGRQALPMVWDYAEANPFADSSGNVLRMSELVANVLDRQNYQFVAPGHAIQRDAMSEITYIEAPVISTDPPYYDNIAYADLSDFFYIWLRYSLRPIYSELFSTLQVPKTQELVAMPYRFGGERKKAQEFFETGLQKVFQNTCNEINPNFPLSVYYAFRQTESENSEENEGKLSVASTGWETMLEALIKSGFSITGTWPIRTERAGGFRNKDHNALASSIVLICRQRLINALNITRRDFLSTLKRELPLALRQLQQGNIAPVDLAQAAIGPGMAIFSRYNAVFEADGSPMGVRAALSLINQELDEYLAQQEGEYDSDTRWALAWFEQYGHEQGLYGVAETLSKAKNTSIDGLTHAGFLEARGGKVHLLRRDELEKDWDPTKDKRLTAWEASQYLIRSLDKEGEKGAGVMLSKLGPYGEIARDLAYRLYTICERKGWSQEALAYNMLVVAWPRIKEQSGKGPRQESLL